MTESGAFRNYGKAAEEFFRARAAVTKTRKGPGRRRAQGRADAAFAEARQARRQYLEASDWAGWTEQEKRAAFAVPGV
jgi:hypothetical protein